MLVWKNGKYGGNIETMAIIESASLSYHEGS
jgi:hypothetical protein